MNELSQALEMTNVEANDEKEMLEGIIKFGGKTVEEVMTARVDITDIENADRLQTTPRHDYRNRILPAPGLRYDRGRH